MKPSGVKTKPEPLPRPASILTHCGADGLDRGDDGTRIRIEQRIVVESLSGIHDPDLRPAPRANITHWVDEAGRLATEDQTDGGGSSGDRRDRTRRRPGAHAMEVGVVTEVEAHADPAREESDRAATEYECCDVGIGVEDVFGDRGSQRTEPTERTGAGRIRSSASAWSGLRFRTTPSSGCPRPMPLRCRRSPACRRTPIRRRRCPARTTSRCRRCCGAPFRLRVRGRRGWSYRQTSGRWSARDAIRPTRDKA